MDAVTLDKIGFSAVREIVASRCACSLGRNLAVKLTPSRDGETVHRWLEETDQMVEYVIDQGVAPFGGVTDITAAVARAVPGCNAGAEDFSLIADTLDASRRIRRFLTASDERLGHLHAMGKKLADFHEEVASIRRVVDGDTVRDDASPHLADLRRQIARTTQDIHDTMHAYLRDASVKKLLTHANVTLHGDRYVLPVRWDHRGRLPGVVHRESHTGQTVFVEPNASVKLNNHLMSLRDHERQEVERLLVELGVAITARSRDIARAIRTLGQIDLVSAKAQYAYQCNCICPTISEGGSLNVREARNPLLEALHRSTHAPGSEVVPIDIRLGDDFDILVITGSNTGGKTVALKTTALLIVMAQAGLHIPARRGATLPLLTDVMIDIGDEQSLEQSLSTFGGHIERMKRILAAADKGGRSVLILLDELGSGTDPDEGGAIGQAILDELARTGCLAIVTTHFSVLKAYALNHDRVDNASVEFDTKTLRPTYRLHIGTPGESHAITVSQRLGLPGRVIDGARKHLGQRGSQFRRAMRKTGKARREAEDARADAATAQAEAEKQAQTFGERIADVHQLREEFGAWAARLGEMSQGDEVHVPHLNKTGRLHRLELHKQRAIVDVDQLQIEVPLSELMPDLGQRSVRAELQKLRRTAADQAKAAEQDREAILKDRAALKKQIQRQQEEAKRFDRWMSRISRAKVGDEVTVATKPGRGKLVEVDFKGLRAVVEVAGGQKKTVSLQELFPQTGPYAEGAGKGSKGRRHKGGGTPKGQNRPMDRGADKGRRAKKSLSAVKKIKPGEKIYVIPFKAAATLVRIDEKKSQAIVSRGAFEMQVSLSDCAPMGYDA